MTRPAAVDALFAGHTLPKNKELRQRIATLEAEECGCGGDA